MCNRSSRCYKIISVTVNEQPNYLVKPTIHQRSINGGIKIQVPVNVCPMPEKELSTILMRILQRQHALGSNRFRVAIEAQLGRRAGPGVIGRPRKARDSQESALCPLFLSAY